MKINLKWHEKLAVIALLGIVLVNPLIGQYIIELIITAYEQLFLIADYVSIVAACYLIGYFIWRNNENGKVKIPTKRSSKKKKTPKYLET